MRDPVLITHHGDQPAAFEIPQQRYATESR